MAFWSTYFGWKPVFDLIFEGPEFSQSVGEENARCRSVGGWIGYLRLELVEANWAPTPPPPDGLGPFCLTFQVDDINAFHAQCVADGIRTLGPPSSVSGTLMMFAWDPDGQQIEIVQYFETSDAWGGPGKGCHPLLAS